MKNDIDFVHIEAIKVEKHVFSVHDVGKNDKSLEFTAIMQQKAASDVAHALDVAQVWPQKAISKKDIFQRLIELIAKSKNTHFRISTMQIFLNNF